MSAGSDLRDDAGCSEGSEGNDLADEGASLLETVVNAHYLALQMRMLVKGRRFTGSEATELLASALTEWAQLAGGECFETGSASALATVTSRERH
jgi:hypothetical protein